MIPTEHEYTVATHAAARKLYEMSAARVPSVVLTAGEKTAGVPDWDDVPLVRKREYLETVLPLVNAVISAIPDRGARGFQAGALWAYDIHPGDPMPDDEIAKAAREYTNGKSE